jgi:hypothetical protein
MYVYLHVSVHACMQCVHLRMRTQSRMHACICQCLWDSIFVFMFVQCVHLRPHACTPRHTVHVCYTWAYVCMWACMYACVFFCIYIWPYACTSFFVAYPCLCVRTHIGMYARAHHECVGGGAEMGNGVGEERARIVFRICVPMQRA